MTTQDIEQLIEQIEDTITFSKNTIQLASVELSDEQYEAIEIGWLDDEVNCLKSELEKFKIKLWQQQIKEL